MSQNPIFDAIEDELIRCLERGAKLPEDFTINLSREEFRAMMEAGMISLETGKQMPMNRTWVVVTIADLIVRIRSEEDPDSWEPEQ